MKPKITENNDYVFKTHKSYSPEEVLAAGGTTAFALKHGKTLEALKEALSKAAPVEPFTDEEWADLLIQLKNDK